MLFHTMHLLIVFFGRIRPLLTLLSMWGYLKHQNR